MAFLPMNFLLVLEKALHCGKKLMKNTKMSSHSAQWSFFLKKDDLEKEYSQKWLQTYNYK
jgi:hypothetical protein